MKERPILFSAPMVSAILEGRKTQTRWAAKHPLLETLSRIIDCGNGWWGDEEGEIQVRCPYGQPGDRLWVRETWQGPLLDEDYDHPEDDDIYTPKYCVYRADGGPVPEFVTCDDKERSGWRPSIHMPRWASRILLEVVSVRVERLQDISEADAKSEGCDDRNSEAAKSVGWCERPQRAFHRLWEHINGPNSWDANPWVWVVEFRRVIA